MRDSNVRKLTSLLLCYFFSINVHAFGLTDDSEIHFNGTERVFAQGVQVKELSHVQLEHELYERGFTLYRDKSTTSGFVVFSNAEPEIKWNGVSLKYDGLNTNGIEIILINGLCIPWMKTTVHKKNNAQYMVFPDPACSDENEKIDDISFTLMMLLPHKDSETDEGSVANSDSGFNDGNQDNFRKKGGFWGGSILSSEVNALPDWWLVSQSASDRLNEIMKMRKSDYFDAIAHQGADNALEVFVAHERMTGWRARKYEIPRLLNIAVDLAENEAVLVDLVTSIIPDFDVATIKVRERINVAWLWRELKKYKDKEQEIIGLLKEFISKRKESEESLDGATGYDQTYEVTCVDYSPEGCVNPTLMKHLVNEVSGDMSRIYAFYLSLLLDFHLPKDEFMLAVFDRGLKSYNFDKMLSIFEKDRGLVKRIKEYFLPGMKPDSPLFVHLKVFKCLDRGEKKSVYKKSSKFQKNKSKS